jgi:hypothetical protein
METLKISLKDVIKTHSTKKSATLSDDYIEIICKYLKIYQGTWVKYQNKESEELFSGGYLVDVTDEDIAIIRNIRKEIFEVGIYEHYFFAKQDSPHHSAVKEIIKEKEKLKFDIKAFNLEKQKFIQKRQALT